MLEFQREPESDATKKNKQPARCKKCHKTLITKLTSEKDPYCMSCGHIVGTSVQPATWVCEDCGEIIIDTRPGDRPWCISCKVPMSCLRAAPSRIHGVGAGDVDLDLGLYYLLEAQAQVKPLGIPEDEPEGLWEMLARGEDLLRDAQESGG